MGVRPLLLRWLGVFLSFVVTALAQGQREPELIQSTLRLAPTSAQAATWPAWPALWLLPSAFSQDTEARLVARGLSNELARTLISRIALFATNSGAGVEQRMGIVPDEALLSLFSPQELELWHRLLASQVANLGSRWPVVVESSSLDAIGGIDRGPAIVALIKRFALPDPAGKFWRLHDPWLLNDALSRADDRDALVAQLLSTHSTWVKVRTSATDFETVREDAAYWQSQGRYRAIEPILQALGAVTDRDRIDLIHLIPRLPRALINSFPVAFDRSPDPSADNAQAFANFFGFQASAGDMVDLSAWLEQQCDPIEGPRAFGDAIVFEDPARTRWPYTAIYIADGLVFGRRPTLSSPWGLWRIDELRSVNPRLAVSPTRAYRPRSDLAGEEDDPFTPMPPPRSWIRPTALRPLAEGPWGRLWTYDIFLTPSASLLSRLPEPAAEPAWPFRRFDAALRESLLQIAALDRAQREALRSAFASARPSGDGTTLVQPSPDLVVSLPPAWRTEAYRFLRGTGRVTDYFQEIRVIQPLVAADLPASVADALLPLIYPRNGRFAVGDYGLVYHLTQDADDRVAMLQALSRTPARIVLLERPAPEEVPALSAYWEAGGRKDLRLLLDAFAAQTETTYLDITHLLPPLPREYMNLFVRPRIDQPVPSCYWTALNFSRPIPDPRFLITPGLPGDEVDVIEKELRMNYIVIDQPSEPGDVIAYYDRDNPRAPQHVCSYIAADLVFTKNGFGYDAPWCLTPRKEVDDLYLLPRSGEVRYYRLKSPAPSAAKK